VPLAAFLIFSLQSTSPVTAATACTFERAHYELQGHPDVTADFVLRPIPPLGSHGPLFLHLNIHSLGWDYWYEFDTGSGYSDISLISVDNPHSPGWRPPDPDSRKGRPHTDQTYFGINSDLTFRTDVPAVGSAAQKYLFIPEFGQDVWYDARTMGSGHRYGVPRAFFVLDQCKR
jgi:hypothetical protein